MFESLPTELLEQIFMCLCVIDLVSVFCAFNKQYSVLSEFFWKRKCLEEDFMRVYSSQKWYECFQCEANKRLGKFTKIHGSLPGSIEHIYLDSIIICNSRGSINKYSIYFLDDQNNFNIVQHIEGTRIEFKEEFIILIQDYEKNPFVLIYMYNNYSKTYDYYRSIPEYFGNIFGISSTYCTAYDSSKKCINLHKHHYNSLETVLVQNDVKLVINKILHRPTENIAITTLSFNERYKIKVYDINMKLWILDLVCFGSTGITNDPNMWLGSNFVGCCDVSYRLRGIYFGPFKVWNKIGQMIITTDIEPSNKHYLRCFFKDKHVILTTSENTIDIYNIIGERIMKSYLNTSFSDVKLSTGRLLFILQEETFIEVYDWSKCEYLYRISLQNKCEKLIISDFLCCSITNGSNDFQVIKFC